MKIIAILGISGVGKSTLVEKAAKHASLLHLVASDLIRARLAQTSEQLRQGTVLDNQALMLAEFAERTATSDRDIIVFDGHSVIDTPAGLIEIPLSVFKAIKPNAIVFVEDSPDAIVTRRMADTGRVRPNRTSTELAQHQGLAKFRAVHIARSLGVPLHTVAPDNMGGILAVFS